MAGLNPGVPQGRGVSVVHTPPLQTAPEQQGLLASHACPALRQQPVVGLQDSVPCAQQSVNVPDMLVNVHTEFVVISQQAGATLVHWISGAGLQHTLEVPALL